MIIEVSYLYKVIDKHDETASYVYNEVQILIVIIIHLLLCGCKGMLDSFMASILTTHVECYNRLLVV